MTIVFTRSVVVTSAIYSPPCVLTRRIRRTRLRRIGRTAQTWWRSEWVICRRRLDELVFVRVRGRGRPRRQVQLREDVAQVSRHGLFADAEPGGNRAIGGARRDETQYLD